MGQDVVGLEDLNRSMLALAGGKGANLGELTRIKGLRVPEGFCVTTEVYAKVVGNHPDLKDLLAALARVKADEFAKIKTISAKIRALIAAIPIPDAIAAAIGTRLAKAGEDQPFAVRSSATAEDLPTASFAGQQDTYLNVIGKPAILKHISRCWASLYTDRAIVYRLQNGFDHRSVQLAVVVQKMVFPDVAGTLFTADPVTGHRKVCVVDASFGLGEALVSGLVNADHYKVRDGRVIERKVATKKLSIAPLKDGGTQERAVPAERQAQAALSDEHILALARTGRVIEAHFACPQDIEWCWADGHLYVVQSRPITTLFPLPEVSDSDFHVYISVGHQQMMTDPMKPLGLSFFQMTGGRPMAQAGGRLFVDIAAQLRSPATRGPLVEVLGLDPLIKSALRTIIERGDVGEATPGDAQALSGRGSHVPTVKGHRLNVPKDPSAVAKWIQSCEALLASLKESLQAKEADTFACILNDMAEARKLLFDTQNMTMVLGAMDAVLWVNEKMEEWLGEKGAADILSQSVPHNITSEMGLALLDVADVIRPYPEVVAFLQDVQDESFLERLAFLRGGPEARDAIQSFLTTYGMRCAGEIDITRPRWAERPSTLVPIILGNVRNFEAGAAKRKFEQGLQEARKKEEELLTRLAALPDGAAKVDETKRMIDLIRNFVGFREYPKYSIVSRYFVYKQALLKEAERLVADGVLSEREDVFYLSFEELREAVRTRKMDHAIVRARKEAFLTYEKLSPPRVMTSDGETLTGVYQRENIPAGALIGLPVSSGIIEGRARVILSLEHANLAEGDILVTPFSDPSWTPLFVSIKGLVTEVGGLMTHGAVIAREYGLPAVVGVERATQLIQDGQRIRVNGTDGFVEII